MLAGAIVMLYVCYS